MSCYSHFRAKIQIENKKGETVLDIAKAYGNLKIIDTLQEIWDSLPNPKDKRKRKGANAINCFFLN